MSWQGNVDISVTAQSMPTGVEGVRALEKFMKDGNSEVRKLLHDECDVLLECRYCRNIFRSTPNFITHKRTFCKVSHVKVTLSNGTAEEEVRPSFATKKKTGLIQALNKRMESIEVPIANSPELLTLHTLPRICKELPVTTFADGRQQIVGSLPGNLAKKEGIPTDRTFLVMPQDNSSRYQEMTLRNRRMKDSLKSVCKEMDQAEIALIERFTRQNVKDVDFVNLTCEAPSCTHLRPFGSIKALAYHCSIKHLSLVMNCAGKEVITCLLCTKPCRSKESLAAHLPRIHMAVKNEHLKKRKEEDGSKPGRRSTGPKRARSLSLSAESSSEEEEDNKEEGIKKEEEAESEENSRHAPSIRREGSKGRSKSGKNAEGTEDEEEDEDENENDNSNTPSTNSSQRSSVEHQNDEGDVEDIQSEAILKCVEFLVRKICKEEKRDEKGQPRRRPGRPRRSIDHSSSAEQKGDSKKRGRRPRNQSIEDESKKEKRKYEKSEDEENGEESGGEVDQDVSTSSAVSRPSRDRKRPRWMAEDDFEMVNGGMTPTAPPKKSTRDEEDNEDSSFVLPREKEKSDKKPRKTTSKSERSSLDKTMGDEEESGKNSNTTPKKKDKNPENDKIMYTPMAGKMIVDERKNRAASVDEDQAGSRKRKQNLGILADEYDDFQIVQVGDAKPNPRRSDLATVPVFLSETQQHMFFDGLKPVYDGDTVTHHQCIYCNINLSTVRDGRRHMVAHLRVMRLKCALCGAGAFFCVDMRNHLQNRGCPNLDKAPRGIVKDGLPCMTKAEADGLTFIAHPTSPGRTLFTSGKIVSILNNRPYLPDPVIEEKILGPARVPPRLANSPRKMPLKFMKSSVLKEIPRPQLDPKMSGALRQIEGGTGTEDEPVLYEDTEDTPHEHRIASDTPPRPSSQDTPPVLTPSTSSQLLRRPDKFIPFLEDTVSSLPITDADRSRSATPSIMRNTLGISRSNTPGTS